MSSSSSHRRAQKIFACADRMPDPQRRERYINLMFEADRLHSRATELRYEAWDLYNGRDLEGRFA